MAEVTAKIKIKGKSYEILVDVDKALQFKKGRGKVDDALIGEAVFHNIKAGDRAGEDDLEEAFNTTELRKIAEKIIKSGEIAVPAEYLNKERQEKLKQVVDFLVKNAINPSTGNPYTPTRIEDALKEAGINVENKPVEAQISGILEKLRTILPIKIETKKLRVLIPAIYTGQVYGLVNEHKEKENWLDNGDLQIVINIPAGLQMDFYDKLNAVAHGSAIVEEIK